MKKSVLTAVLALGLGVAVPAIAGDQYNDVPAGDAQYKECKSYAMKRWEGGGESSPFAGQSKAEAFCTCLWNETPDDFKGSLAKFSESDKGEKINKICEKYSDWQS